MAHYILDGYNIIKSGPDRLLAEGSLQKQREFLLELLVEYLAGAKEAAKITVVFDGPESVPYFSSNASVSSYRGIKVVFSEGRTADQRIEELVLACGNPADTTVVTNDKGIRRLLGGTGASFMGVAEFAEKLFPRISGTENQEEAGLDKAAVESIDKELGDIWLKRK